jgi:hypothetical protein
VLALAQGVKSAFIETADPILDRSGTLTQQARHFVGAESFRHRQHPVQAMVVSGLVRTLNFFINGQSHDFCVVDFQFAHSDLRFAPQKISGRYMMRNIYDAAFGSSEKIMSSFLLAIGD